MPMDSIMNTWECHDARASRAGQADLPEEAGLLEFRVQGSGSRADLPEEAGLAAAALLNVAVQGVEADVGAAAVEE